ncbi:hypothetical protein NDN08_004492 [Rhodosorus marinus]|uniref:Golgi apparatus membrane protein TVP23 homolog n=1 Tax=Rhodosorus marinus TaxID=101924 RepID=A0AAV8UMX4_9RHOD|nr:hypothetical protein NDN08_004492 [Rhodosorus marinus]
MSSGDENEVQFYEEESLPHVTKGARVEQFDVEEGGGGLDDEGGGGAIGTILRKSSHPGVALFHVGLKLAAIASYLLLGFFLGNFVVQFVVTVTLLAFDFWTVKNVSGRLMVGLRWWTDVNEDGTTAWRFECKEDNNTNSVIDSRLFWWSMYLQPVLWVGLGIVCIFRFEFTWLLVVAVALILTGTNLVAYFKCSRQQQEQMRSYMASAVMDQAMSYFRGSS